MEPRYEITYTFEHEGTDEEETVSFEVGKITDNCTDVGWLKLVLRKTESYATVRDAWHRRRTGYAYANEPWDDWTDLERVLEDITGVSRVVYEDPYTGAYGPPKYVLFAADDASTGEIATTVREYYAGLAVEEQVDHVDVIVSPTAKRQ